MTAPADLPVTLADILAARRRLRGVADATPMIEATALGARLGRRLWLKLESVQPTGAFKIRGATNAVATLPPDCAGVTCCSTGNHGRALAHAARARGLRAVICMSRLVPETKLAAVRALGAEVHVEGASQDEAEAACQRLAAAEGLAVVPPFDHPDVIAGQGTIGLEMLEAVPDLAALLIPLSGGGLAAGVALAARAINPAIRLVGVSMENGAAMHAALRAGRPVPVTEVPSLADSLGGGLGADNRYSFALCRALLDETVTVGEEEIYRAMQRLYYDERLVAEGACAVGIAALEAGRPALPAGPVATIVTARNVDMAQFTDIITGRSVRLGDRIVRGARYAG